MMMMIDDNDIENDEANSKLDMTIQIQHINTILEFIRKIKLNSNGKAIPCTERMENWIVTKRNISFLLFIWT